MQNGRANLVVPKLTMTPSLPVRVWQRCTAEWCDKCPGQPELPGVTCSHCSVLLHTLSTARGQSLQLQSTLPPSTPSSGVWRYLWLSSKSYAESCLTQPTVKRWPLHIPGYLLLWKIYIIKLNGTIAYKRRQKVGITSKITNSKEKSIRLRCLIYKC